MAERKVHKCLWCGKETTEPTRGVCGSFDSQNCYATLFRKVQRGETTWDQLIAEGKALPSKRQRRRDPPPTTKTFTYREMVEHAIEATDFVIRLLREDKNKLEAELGAVEQKLEDAVGRKIQWEDILTALPPDAPSK